MINLMFDLQTHNQEFAKGEGKRGAWGRNSPSGVKGQSHSGVWARSPRKPKKRVEYSTEQCDAVIQIVTKSALFRVQYYNK